MSGTRRSAARRCGLVPPCARAAGLSAVLSSLSPVTSAPVRVLHSPSLPAGACLRLVCRHAPPPGGVHHADVSGPGARPGTCGGRGRWGGSTGAAGHRRVTSRTSAHQPVSSRHSLPRPVLPSMPPPHPVPQAQAPAAAPAEGAPEPTPASEAAPAPSPASGPSEAVSIDTGAVLLDFCQEDSLQGYCESLCNNLHPRGDGLRECISPIYACGCGISTANWDCESHVDTRSLNGDTLLVAYCKSLCTQLYPPPSSTEREQLCLPQCRACPCTASAPV